MSSQIAVRSIDALKDLRTALALYGEDTLGALGAIGAEVRRTMYWLQQERPMYWQEQIKRRRDRLAAANAELFRRKLMKTSSSSPSVTEQVENVKRAEASLQDAEKRLVLTRRWQGQLRQAVMEYHGSIRRIKGLAAGDVPKAVNLLSRLIDSLEAYLAVAPPSGSGSSTSTVTSAASAPAEFETIATTMIDREPPAEETSEEGPDDSTLDEEYSGDGPSESLS